MRRNASMCAFAIYGKIKSYLKANTVLAVRVRAGLCLETLVKPFPTVVCVVFTTNRPSYPTTSVHPVSVLILHLTRDTNSVVTDYETEYTKQSQLIKVLQVKC